MVHLPIDATTLQKLRADFHVSLLFSTAQADGSS